MNGRTAVVPDAFGRADAATIRQVIERAASPDFERWWARVADSGHCAAPVHLTGTGPSGQRAHVLARCKNRRTTICPSCSRLYAGDTWQLVHRGIATIEDATTGQFPAGLASLTAPSFGAVHRAGLCHPARRRRCPHNRSIGCGGAHASNDPAVGTPLCGDCYDYQAHVLFTWHAPELWHRFTITLRRALRRKLNDLGGDPTDVRLSYVKVVELQQRGVPHYHAVLRLDPASDGATTRLTSAGLAELVASSASAARLRVPGAGAGTTIIRFGQQIDVQPLGSDLGTARSRAVAGYLAKYVTKSVGDLGLSARGLSPQAIDRLDISEHVRRILHTIVDLAEQPERTELVRWLHTLGYRGHVSSKTRHYSTTMTALRANRAAWRTGSTDRGTGTTEPLVWEYAGNGHATEGDRLLVTSAAHRAIEQQRAARESIRDDHAVLP